MATRLERVLPSCKEMHPRVQRKDVATAFALWHQVPTQYHTPGLRQFADASLAKMKANGLAPTSLRARCHASVVTRALHLAVKVLTL